MLQPVGDKVLILPDAPPEKVGRVYLPDAKEFRPRYGLVQAVGPGKLRYEPDAEGGAGGLVRVPMSVAVGDRVAFSQYGTDGVETVDGQEVLIIPEGKILAIEKPASGAASVEWAETKADERYDRERAAYRQESREAAEIAGA